MVRTCHRGPRRAIASDVVRRQHSLTGGRVSSTRARTRVSLTRGPPHWFEARPGQFDPWAALFHRAGPVNLIFLIFKLF
jgi:hypothetical protein